MSNTLLEHIDVRIFIGCLLTSDLEHLLNQSCEWKGDLLETQSTGNEMNKTVYRNKDYLGFFVNDDGVLLNDIDTVQEKIQTMIHNYCPEYPSNKLQFFVFPQVFVT